MPLQQASRAAWVQLAHAALHSDSMNSGLFPRPIPNRNEREMRTGEITLARVRQLPSPAGYHPKEVTGLHDPAHRLHLSERSRDARRILQQRLGRYGVAKDQLRQPRVLSAAVVMPM